MDTRTPEIDADLVARARDRGDMAAFEELVRRHRDAVYRVALRICLDEADAQDAAQEALVRAWRRLHTYRGDAAFRTWLYRIVTNVALNQVSRRRDRPTDPALLPEPAGHDADPSVRVEHRQRLEAAAAALAALTPQQRACWILREVEGLRYDELADVLGVSVQATKSRLHRARAELAAALARYDRG